MPVIAPMLPDLMPPAFAEGLDDWSRGDGTPDSPTYERSETARLAQDPDFGLCLELRPEEPVQRLRYMGELPVLPGVFLEISARLKVLRAPLPEVRIAAWPGGAHGRRVDGAPSSGAVLAVTGPGAIVRVQAVTGPAPGDGIDLAWDSRVLYAHVGLDLLGARGGIVRVENLVVREAGIRQVPQRPRCKPDCDPTRLRR